MPSETNRRAKSAAATGQQITYGCTDLLKATPGFAGLRKRALSCGDITSRGLGARPTFLQQQNGRSIPRAMHMYTPECSCMQDCACRPRLSRLCPGVQIFVGTSTCRSREMAKRVLAVAEVPSDMHVFQTTTMVPRRHARKFPELEEENRLMLQWCSEWVWETFTIPSDMQEYRSDEPHIVSYCHDLATGNLQTTKLHRDKSFASIIMAVSEPSSYKGGGTHFPFPNTTVRLKPGEVLVFMGDTLHCGKAITQGERHLYMAFAHLTKFNDVMSAPTPAAQHYLLRRSNGFI